MRALSVLISATGLAGAASALALTAYTLRSGEVQSDPAHEIRRSAPAAPSASPPTVAAAPGDKPIASATVEAPRGQSAVRAPMAVTEPPRAVAPLVVAIPPVVAGDLERVEPRPPLSVIAAAPPPRKPAPKPLLFRPLAETAGVIAAAGRTIEIGGIEPVGGDETCARADGGVWPCGRAALTAFRGFMRGRAVTCDFPAGEVADRISTTCRIGSHDIGAWLVENGWARAVGSGYERQAAAAAAARRGIFGPGPSALPADPVDRTSGIVTPVLPDTAGPADISILPPEFATPAAGPSPLDQGVEDELPPGSRVGEAPPGVSPLPPPSSPQ